MRVKFLKTYAGPDFAAAVGTEILLPDEVVLSLEKVGAVEVMGKHIPETPLELPKLDDPPKADHAHKVNAKGKTKTVPEPPPTEN